MGTKKLFYEDPAPASCRAAVLECRKVQEHYEVVLDQTCFYPEGGGQPGDTGMLDACRVFDTREKDGLILHYTEVPVLPGTTVSAQVDWERRFDYMQQHSGEHMVSGRIHACFGLDNVGFHMGADRTTIDFSGELTWEQLQDIERDVNGRIWRNEPVRAWFPSPEELASLSYRSKKELTGDVRIVEFPGTDLCACCGTHVTRTGEIGLVKILSCEKFHGGCRIELLCGQRAADHLSAVFEQNRQISRLFSAKPLETARAASASLEEINEKRIRIYQLEEALFAAKAEALAQAGNVLVFLDGLSADGVRRACDAIQQTCKGCAAVFSGEDTNGYKYAVGLPGGDLRPLVLELNRCLNGRGGGKPSFAQGSVQASGEQIRAFWETLPPSSD